MTIPPTTETDIVNLALQYLGTRTTVTAADLQFEGSNEAIQANLSFAKVRHQTLRMAPWNFSTMYANLSLITSAPGTKENQTMSTTNGPLATLGGSIWQRGIPFPPWMYEYCYPWDCLRPLFIVPQFRAGFAETGVPVTTAVTGGSPAWWNGPPVAFKVASDMFYSLASVNLQTGGTGYSLSDAFQLFLPPQPTPPIGAPPWMIVNTAPGAGGAIVTATPGTPLAGQGPLGGSYFREQPNPIPAGPARNLLTGIPSPGTGASFNITGYNFGPQRVILTNQPDATLCYVQQVTAINTMDDLFIDAWVAALGARLAMALTGDKTLANAALEAANAKIVEARKADGNEGLTVNDVTPDWIRTRGISFPSSNLTGPFIGFEWGNLWPLYG